MVLSAATAVYKGTTPVNKIYQGSTLIWPKGGHDYSGDYLTIEILSTTGETALFTFEIYSGTTVEYNINNSGWSSYTQTTVDSMSSITANCLVAELNEGDTIQLKSSNYGYFSGRGGKIIVFGGTWKVYGNILSVVFGDNFKDGGVVSTYSLFRSFFRGTYSLPHLEDSVTLYDDAAYNLVDASNLVMNFEVSGNNGGIAFLMFGDSYGLVNPPKELNIYPMTSNDFRSMFSDCINLTTMPKLSITHDCSAMFSGCISLTKAELPDTPLTGICYNVMFEGCSNLSYVKCLATSGNYRYSTSGWLCGAAQNGTFVKAAGAAWEVSSDRSRGGIPSGWTVVEE